MVNPIYNDWLAELVPSKSRGSYFSNRNAIITAIASVVGIGGGFLLDAFRSRHLDATGYAVIFGIGFAFAMLSYFFFWRMTDVPRPQPVKEDTKHALAAFGVPFKDPAYRPVLIFLGFASFAQGLPGALFAPYALQTLGLPVSIFQIAGACQAVGIVISARFWGFVSDRYGNKPMLIIAGLLLSLNLVPWILARPHQILFDSILLLNCHVFMGIFWGGINLCQFNIMLSTAPPRDRANYMGAGLAITALIGGVAPLVGAKVVDFLFKTQSEQGAYQILYSIDLVLRLVTVAFLAPVREAGSQQVKTALRHFRQATPTGMRALRTLNRSIDADSREEALDTLAEEGFDLAAAEVVKALNDPVPRVRRGAAQALTRLQDPSSKRQAAEALIRQIDLHPDLVEEEMVEALGSMGDPSAQEPLIRLLRSPRSLVRRAAARALGRLGNQTSISVLAEAAKDGDPDLRRAALQALRLLNAQEAAETIALGVLDERPSVRVAAAEAVVDLDLKGGAVQLRTALQHYRDESMSSLAYALGHVGDLSDLPLILNAAKDCSGVATRHEAMLGAATLLGVESEVYRLMLLDGMARDTAVMDLLRGITRKNKRAEVALTFFSSGKEVEALKAIAKAVSLPGLDALTQTPVEDGFLIAAAIAGNQS